ncbi:MAG: DNA-methyltransferase [bacterium]
MKPLLLNEDSLDALKNMEGEELFDLILLDPPYFDYKTNYRKDKKGKLSQSLVQQDIDDQLETVRECIKKLKTGHAFYFFTNWQEAWWFQAKFYTFLRNEIIWYKGNWTAGDLEGSFASCYEVIFLGVKGKGWEYNGERLPDIWGAKIKGEEDVLPRVGTNRIHATEKPVNLYKKLIELSTEPGAYVLDPYVGSGASAVAAMQTGRLFLGYEKDKDYWKVAVDRVEKEVKDGPENQGCDQWIKDGST